MRTRARYLAFWLLLAAPHPVWSQTPEEWRARFAAGEEARVAGDHDIYAAEMAAAARAMAPDHLNRPFVQYHAARAAALVDRRDEAVAWLRRAWDESIESLMISFAPYDPAFEPMLDDPAFRAVMALPAEMELDVRRLADGLFLIEGAGANALAQVGADGVLLVDTGYGPALPALRAALSSVGANRVDRLMLTHPHEDHMGAAAELGAEAEIVAHPGTAEAMRVPYVFIEGVEMPPKPASAMPDVEIVRDTTLHFNGEDVRIVPTVAHTAGDLSVYFTRSRVAHLGDTWLAANPMMYPGDEDPEAFLDELEVFLDSMHPETVIVGGHEQPADLAAVRAQIDETRACMALVRESLAEGLSLDEAAEHGADRFPPQWIAFFYRLFTRNG